MINANSKKSIRVIHQRHKNAERNIRTQYKDSHGNIHYYHKHPLIVQNQRLEREIQECLKTEAEFRKLAFTDELTGLYNRRGFFFLANDQLKLVKHPHQFFYLLFIDLDGLKRINDSLGHEAGNNMIVATANILKETFRDSDIIARIGGDEFVLFVFSDSNNGNDLYLRLAGNVNKFNQEHDYLFQVSISVGIKQCSVESDVPLEKLLRDADQLMYEHKRTKRSL